MIIYDPTITGSFQINGTSISSIGDIDNISQSVDVLTGASSSFSSRVSMVEGSVNSLNTATGSYATQTYVTTALNNLIDAAPASLDTLNELAAALNDDANFATTVTNALATKLNLSGGNITGNLSVDTDTFYVDSSNNRVGIGIGSPTTALDVRSGDTSTQITIGASNGGTYGRLYADNDGDLILGADAGDNAANSYMGFEVDGSERMRIDSSGNVGIGTSSPAARIDYGSATGEAFYLHNGSGDVYGIDMAVYDGDGFSTNIFSGGGGKIKLRTRSAGANPLTTKMTIDSSGNVGIGTSSPAAKFQVVDQSTTGKTLDVSATEKNSGTVLRAQGGSSIFTGSLIEGYGTRASTNGSYNLFYVINQNGSGEFKVLDSGNAQNTNNSYGGLSDIKLKENIVDTGAKLERLSQVRVVDYNLKQTPDKKLIGVVAQELEQVFPGMVEELIDRDYDGKDLGTTTKSVKYSVFVPMLIKAMQELKDIVDRQQIEIDNLKAQLK